MSSYGDMKIFGGVVTLLHPPQGGHFKKKLTFFKKWQFVYVPKITLKMIRNDT